MEPELFQRMGIAAIGSRLRRLSDEITADAAQFYQQHGLDFEPRWFPVIYLLDVVGPLHVSDLAGRIGQSHAAVSQAAKAMKKRGLIVQTRDKTDGRKQLLTLSKAGQLAARKISDYLIDVEAAVRELLGEGPLDLWQAMRQTESALQQKSFYTRTRSQYTQREQANIAIAEYAPRYETAFRELNREWIETYFRMEPTDERALDNPQAYILDVGGHILVALYDDQPVGVVALVPLAAGQEYELAKMAVSPAVQGKGIGYRLGQACLAKAKALGAKRIYLESNTILQPAIALYRKLGFREIEGQLPSPYARSNIQMELRL